MIKIAIIDDDAGTREREQSLVKETAPDMTDELEISCFKDGSSFLRRLAEGERVDILLCDIKLPDTNGIDIGRAAKSQYSRLYLIYLTSYSEYAVESYMVEAYQYIMKEHMEKRLPEVLRPLLEKLQRETRQYKLIGTNTNRDLVYYRDIISICKEKSLKYVRYTTTAGEYRERSTLDKVMRELDSREFVLVERGIVINMKHVDKIKENTIFMDNGEQIYASRAHIMKVKQQIHRYWRES